MLKNSTSASGSQASSEDIPRNTLEQKRRMRREKKKRKRAESRQSKVESAATAVTFHKECEESDSKRYKSEAGLYKRNGENLLG